MPPKKAAKKVAKKAPGQHDPHKAAKDARRTFEHLGRVQALSSLTSSESESLSLLMKTADGAYQTQQYKESADILRAAEHLSFAALHVEATETVAAELKKVIQEETEHLIERSVEHSSHHDIPETLLTLLARMTKDAKAAMRRGSYRSALEFARGAEALSHVHHLDLNMLPAPAAQKHLKA